MSTQPAPFLVTTALEEFWDTSKPLLFLGDWCRLYGRKSYWSSLDGQLARSPWQTLEEVEATCSYASAVCDELLPRLADALNTVHRVQHSLRYWRIVLGPWLLFYVHTTLDRFLRIREVAAQHPDFTSLALSEGSFSLARDSMEFVDLCKTDVFNLQMYSRVFSFMGKSFPALAAEEKPRQGTPSKQTLTPKLFLQTAANFAVKKTCLAIKERAGLFFKSSYFAPDAELKLFLKTGWKFRPVGRKPVRVGGGVADASRRQTLGSFMAGGDAFRSFLKETLPLDLPRCFIEAFQELKAEAALYPPNPTAIFTSNAYFFDEAFKVWAAEKVEKGIPLLGSQHGGNYGVAKHLYLLEHEVAICDRYYSWGWSGEGKSAEVVRPFPAAKLAGRARIGADNAKEGILLASTASFRYLVQFPHLPEYFEGYLEWQKLFCAGLDRTCRSKLRVRLLAENLGWDMKERWLDNFPKLQIEQEGGGLNFQMSLERCRLFVADHISTTYIEALSSDKPTVMFYNHATYPVRGEAQKGLDLLKKAGILHETPEQAAQTVNSVYADVERWWNDPSRQAARIEFCNSYGRTSADAVGEWSRELLSVFQHFSQHQNQKNQGIA